MDMIMLLVEEIANGDGKYSIGLKLSQPPLSIFPRTCSGSGGKLD